MAEIKIKDYVKYFFRIVKENLYYNSAIRETPENIYRKVNIDVNFYPKVMSFNLRRDVVEDGCHNWQYRRGVVTEFIREVNPNIMGNQEIMPNMFKYLISELKDSYDWYGVNSLNGRPLEKSWNMFAEGLTLFWHRDKYKCTDRGCLWLSDTPTKPSRSWGNKVPRIAIWVLLTDIYTGKKFYVFNTHFDHKSDEHRYKSAELLESVTIDLDSETFADDIFVMGDFNCSYDSQALSPLNATFQNNVVPSIPTFTGFEFTKSKIIDMIFSMRSEYKSQVFERDHYGHNISDHNALMIYEDSK